MPSRFSFAHLCLALLIPVFTSCQGDARPRSAGPRIVGTGVTDAPEDRFPYMCSLRRNGDATHVCGAFVVDKRWVVTAAHCVDPDIFGTTGFAAELYCGIHFVNDDNPEQRYATVGGIVHEAWTGNVYEGYDIAMLKLDREVKSPVPRLNFAGNPPKRERSIGAIGWGKVNEFAFADELQITLQLRVVSHTECDAKWENVIIQKDMMICTSVDRADTCDGDSGGPLFLPHMPQNSLVSGDPSRDLVFGMTSFGRQACEPGTADDRPAVYTSIGYFADWIREVTVSSSEREDQTAEGDSGSSPNGDQQPGVRIHPAPEGRFPYMCSVRRERNEHVCGATLINPRWVLTAAQCVDPDRSIPAGLTPVVHCGIYRVNAATDDQIFEGEAFMHPSWSGDDVFAGADIALIKLDRAANLPMPGLSSSGNSLQTSSSPSAVGWGDTPTKSSPKKLHLKESLIYVSNDVCKDILREMLDAAALKAIDEDTMICVGFGKTDACRGDGGGPLLLLDEPNGVIDDGSPSQDLLVGITSFGPAACVDERPSVYTNVSYFGDWIRTTMGENSEK